MADKKKLVDQTKIKSLTTFDTGIRAKGHASILIPGRGRVVIPNPLGDLYFDGSYTKDTGPTHVKDINMPQASGYCQNWDKATDEGWTLKYCQQSDSSTDSRFQFALGGVLSRNDYLYLARRGCTMKNGVLSVPAEKVGEVGKYLNIGK